MLACSGQNNGCNGGFFDATWIFLVSVGTVSEACVPYVSFGGLVPACNVKFCGVAGQKSPFYRAGSARKLEGMLDIMADLKANRPVQASMGVYRDFYSDKSGVYHQVSGRYVGGHAVKIVGWGYDSASKLPYWICANSWGEDDDDESKDNTYVLDESIVSEDASFIVEEDVYSPSPKRKQIESPKRGSSSPSPQKKMKPTSNLLKTFGTGNALVMTDLSYKITLSENYDPVFKSLVISLKRFTHFPFKSLDLVKQDLSNAKQLFEGVYEKIESSKDEKIKDATTIFLKQMRFDDDIRSESDLIQTKYSWMRMMSPSASTNTKIKELDFNILLDFSDFTKNFVYECKKNKVLRLTNIKDLRNVNV